MKLKLTIPAMGLKTGEIYEADVTNNMCHIVIDNKHFWVNRDKFELITVKKISNNYSARYIAKQEHNNETRLNAENHCKPWKDKDLKEIFLEDIDNNQFPNEDIDAFCEKFKRTYCAIEAIVRVKNEYLRTGKIRDFYYDYRNDKLGNNGAQFKRILDKLI